MAGAAARAGGGGGHKIEGSYLGHRVAACDERRGDVGGTGVCWRLDGVQASGAQLDYDRLALR